MYRVTRKLKLIVCFFVGHKISYGDQQMYEPDWCSRCLHDSDELDLEEGITMPILLSRAYCSLVEREWSWFDHLDNRLAKRLRPRWWPSWWEY